MIGPKRVDTIIEGNPELGAGVCVSVQILEEDY
jgi:hypothetical protein